MSSDVVVPLMYRNVSHFTDTEIPKIFNQSWIFSGLLMELNGKTHVGLRVGSTEIILQRDDFGLPRAFLNVCTHRHAQLCEHGRHNGPIRCPYHSWVFDRQGVPTGIPQKLAFPSVVAHPERFQLTEFACEAVGQFIFVRLSTKGPTLRDFLGTQYDFLERVTGNISVSLDEFEETVDANWKVVIENSLEGYHVSTVHNKTLGQVDGMSQEQQAASFFFPDRLHSQLEHAADVDWLKRFMRFDSKIEKWPWRFNHYTHHFIFPNLTITSFLGYSFHIQKFSPSSIDKTEVHSRTMGFDFSTGSQFGRALMRKIFDEGNLFTHRVFQEDKDICRKVQMGLDQAVRPAILGLVIEDRISHFHAAYISCMNN